MERVVLITGAKRIGEEIGRRLIEEGYNLSVIYRHSEEQVGRLKEFGKERGRGVLALKADLADRESFRAVVEETYRSFGRIDAFVHLASPYYRTPIGELKPEDLYNHFVPTLEAFLFLSKYCYEKMMKNEGEVKGRIVAFGDWAVEHTPYKDYSAYLISKGALHTSVKVLAKEFAPHVLVNCVALGPTLKAEEFEDEKWERILRNSPLKREVSLEDVLELTLFLLRAKSITGEIVRLDSGRHIAGSGLGSV